MVVTAVAMLWAPIRRVRGRRRVREAQVVQDWANALFARAAVGQMGRRQLSGEAWRRGASRAWRPRVAGVQVEK